MLQEKGIRKNQIQIEGEEARTFNSMYSERKYLLPVALNAAYFYLKLDCLLFPTLIS